MANDKKDVLMLRLGNALSAGIHEALLSKGFSTVVVAELKECFTTIEKLRAPILLVDCGNEEEQVFNHMKQLIETKELHQRPLIAISKDADGYESVLKRYYQELIVLITPCSVDQIVRALEYLSDRNERKSTPQERLQVNQSKTEIIQASRENLGSNQELHALYSEFATIPEAIFNAINQLGLAQKTLGGASYVRNPTHDELVSASILPSRPELHDVFEATTSRLGRWSRGHLLRAALLADKIMVASVRSENDRKMAAHLQLLFTCSFTNGDRDLAKKDYYGQRALMLRKDLCSRIKDSALKLTTELNELELAKLASILARQIGREERVNEGVDSLIANSVMAADYVDRICYASGAWNPNAAFHLIRHCKSGRLRDFHPYIMAAVIKTLCEAVAISKVIMIHRSKRQKMKEIEENERSQIIAQNEKKIEINDLAPGMRLARPLRSYDGSVILSPDLILDEDLIWRIWQLASIRPLASPVIINRCGSFA
jgi:DNA-binding response OmpR family regulator